MRYATCTVSGITLALTLFSAPSKDARLDAFLAEGEEALSARLFMYWNSHATDVYVRNQTTAGTGGEKAPVPTVMFDGARSHPTQYKRPELEKLPLKAEDPRGIFLTPSGGGNPEWAPYSKTGTIITSVNTEILSLAADGAETNPEKYGALAYNVLDTYLLGILYRNVATDLDHGHMQTLFGMQSMETIHDNTLAPSCRLYAALKPYIAKNHPEKLALYQAALKKWAEVQIDNGVADNNWDIMQLNSILDIACVLEHDAAYEDAKGREHYLDVVMNRSSIRNLSIRDLCKKGFDAETGIWWECPGYSMVTLKDLAKFSKKIKSQTGIDLEKEIPVIKKAYAASAEYLFPDGMLIGFGDTHPAPVPKEIVEAAGGLAEPSRFFHAPNASWLIARSGMDKDDDVAFALNASLGNHQHANGISMELYACGRRIAPDAGIGWSLYSGDDYKEYYSQFPAHNTVMVNSRSTYQVMKSYHAFKLEEHGDDWARVTFREPASGAEQERTVKYTKRPGVKYFIDCFRSRVGDGGEEWHDYYYHGLADEVAFDGELEPTDEIAFAESGLYCLSYIQDKFVRKGEGDLKAVFTTATPRQTTKFYMNWAEGRKFIKALAPATEGLSRAKAAGYNITRDSRTPVIVARQTGEAWKTPFVAVIDPCDCISNVEYTPNSVIVTAKDGVKEEWKF